MIRKLNELQYDFLDSFFMRKGIWNPRFRKTAIRIFQGYSTNEIAKLESISLDGLYSRINLRILKLLKIKKRYLMYNLFSFEEFFILSNLGKVKKELPVPKVIEEPKEERIVPKAIEKLKEINKTEPSVDALPNNNLAFFVNEISG